MSTTGTGTTELTDAMQFSNRYGLDVTIKEYGTTGTVAALVPFANECSLSLTSDITWATGGTNASKIIGFHNPIEGTFKITTQVITDDLIEIIANAATGTDGIVFSNNPKANTKYYVIEATTVWKDKAGTAKSELITIHKAMPKRAYNITYNGSGDPVKIDIEFELLGDVQTDGSEKVVTVKKTAVSGS